MVDENGNLWVRARGFLASMLARAGWTMAQTAIGVIGGAQLFGEVNWAMLGSAVLLAGVLSCLKSVVAGMPEVAEG